MELIVTIEIPYCKGGESWQFRSELPTVLRGIENENENENENANAKITVNSIGGQKRSTAQSE